MLTVSSSIFRATREIAKEVAEEWANLRHEVTSVKPTHAAFRPAYHGRQYDLWEDAQTGGGGCRIVWAGGIVWISRHSGYAYADTTEEVCELFANYFGCKPAMQAWRDNPHVYPK